MKNIGILCGSLSRGGAERVTLQLGRYFADRGIKVCIITGERNKTEYELPDSLERIVLSEKHKGIKTFAKMIKKLRKTIKEKELDTVIIMGVPLCIYGILGCRKTGCKVFVSERNDPLHFAGKRIVKIMSRQLMKKADGFVFQTEDAKDYYKQQLNCPGIVIPNPLKEDISEITVCGGEKKKIIVTAGRLNLQKNHEMLIKAFKSISESLPQYRLVIYGEGNLRGQLEEIINSLGLEHKVSLPGNKNDIYERIKDASLFVMSSDFEGMPNALMEAIALGVPCVSTDCPCGGPRELIKNGYNGRLVPINDIERMTEAIKDVLTDELYALNALKYADFVREEYCLSRIGTEWERYIKMKYWIVLNCPNDEKNDKKWVIDEFEKHKLNYEVVDTKLYNSAMFQTKSGRYKFFYRMFKQAFRAFFKSRPGDILIVWSRNTAGIINYLSKMFGNRRIIFSRVWDSTPVNPSRFDKLLKLQLENPMCRIMMQTDFDRKEWLKKFQVKNIGNIYILPEIYDTNIEFRKPVIRHGNERYIFSGGRGNRDWKRAVDIAESLPDYQFVYIAFRYDWEKKVEHVPDNVKLLFNVPCEEYMDYMKNSTVIILPIVANKKVGGQLNIFMAAQFGIPCLIDDEPYSRMYYPDECKEFLLGSDSMLWTDELKSLYGMDEIKLMDKINSFQNHVKLNFSPEWAFRKIIETTKR